MAAGIGFEHLFHKSKRLMAQRAAGFHRSPLHHLSYLSSIISLFYLLPSCLLSLLLSLINRHRLDVWQSSSANQQATQHTTKRYKPQNAKNRKIHNLITLDDCPLPFRLKSGLRDCVAILITTKDEIPDWQQHFPLHLQPERLSGQQCNSIQMSPRYTRRV